MATLEDAVRELLAGKISQETITDLDRQAVEMATEGVNGFVDHIIAQRADEPQNQNTAMVDLSVHLCYTLKPEQVSMMLAAAMFQLANHKEAGK